MCVTSVTSFPALTASRRCRSSPSALELCPPLRLWGSEAALRHPDPGEEYHLGVEGGHRLRVRRRQGGDAGETGDCDLSVQKNVQRYVRKGLIVIRIQKGPRVEDNVYNVLYDDVFAGGLSCSWLTNLIGVLRQDCLQDARYRRDLISCIQHRVAIKEWTKVWVGGIILRLFPF